MVRKFIFFLSLLCSSTVFSQNVGIGTTSPTQKLDVNGTIRIRQGNPGTGKVLASDVNGNASWEKLNSLSGESVGFGTWGDCSMNNISDFNPVADPNGSNFANFGLSVSMSGTFAIIGASRDNIGTTLDQGSASIFEFNGTNWVFKQKLTDPTGQSGDFFGASVSISGNFAVVGAYSDDVGTQVEQGSACIFEFNGTSWIFKQKITDATGAASDFFGACVWIDAVTGMLFTGSYMDNVGAAADQGSVIFYKYNGTSWIETQKITDPAGAAQDFFGFSLSQSNSNLVVGAYGDDASKGSATIFKYDGSVWTFVQRISNPVGALANDFFGMSVTIYNNDIIVGAPLDEISTLTDQGVVYYFKNNGTTWAFTERMTHHLAEAGDNFGNSVFLSGDHLIIGMSLDFPSDVGSATIYHRIGLGWNLFQYTFDPGGSANQQFGYTVCLDDVTGRFLIGVPNYASGSGKAIFGKIR